MPFQTEMQKAYEEKYGKGPFVAVDSIVEYANQFLCIKRKDNGKVALPGGMVDPGEFFYEAAIRELREETGLFILNWTTGRFFQFYDAPDRDPRGDIKTMVYSFVITAAWDKERTSFTHQTPKAGSDAKDIVWVSKSKMMDGSIDWYADHGMILHDWISRRDK